MAQGLSPFARRLVPARPDLAAAHLRGQVEAARFVEGRPMSVRRELLDMTMAADSAAGLATQLLRGEAFTVYEDTADGLAWGQSGRDGYVGYVETSGLGPALGPGARRITALWSHIYSAPMLKARVTAGLPLGAELVVEGVEAGFARIAGGGFVPEQHLATVAGDTVDHALRFLGTPYLWGGRSARGIDCSGLVQMALAAAGIEGPRDSDMQAALCGRPLDPDEPPERGDLVFWKGHVGLMRDAVSLLHANAHHMAVVCEPFASAVARITAAGGGPVTARRRIVPSQ